METTRKPRKCQSCGHVGGVLAPSRSLEFDALATSAGLQPEQLAETLWSCSGSTFAEDGPVACLRRMAQVRFR